MMPRTTVQPTIWKRCTFAPFASVSRSSTKFFETGLESAAVAPVGELARGAALFDAGAYWEAHEAWEEIWRDELDAVFPAVGPGRTLPHDDGGIAGMVGEIGEGHALLEPQRMLENDHAAIGIHNSRVRFSADPLAPLVVPFETHGNTGVHAASAPLFAVFRAVFPEFAQTDGHVSL